MERHLQTKLTLHPFHSDNFKQHEAYIVKDPILFGDYRNALHQENARLYEDLLDFDAVRALLTEIMVEHCDKLGGTKLVLFEDALDHVTRIHRIIRMNRGHALLVGVGGSGKQSLTKLAAFAAGYFTFEITLSRGYGEAEFREDLKKLYTMVGLENKKTVSWVAHSASEYL